MIFGDDQYENFKLDIIPPFCVYALGQIEAEPFKASAGLGVPRFRLGQAPEIA